MPEQKSFAVFVERPPKAGDTTKYTVMEVDYTEDDTAIQKRIADHINEKRVTPLAAGLTNYAVYTAGTPQEAANMARGEGLSYKSSDEMKRVRADEINAAKQGRAGFFAEYEETFAAFGDIFGGFGGPRRG